MSRRKVADGLTNRQLMSALVSRRKVSEKEPDPDSLDPREFDEGLDVLGELRSNYEAWTGRGDDDEPPVKMSKVDLTGWPSYLQTGLNKIRGRAFTGPASARPSEQAIVWMKLAHGLHALNDHDVVIDARQVSCDFDLLDFEDEELEEVLADWLRTSKVEISIAGASRTRKTVRVGDETKGDLLSMATELGVAVGPLAVLAIMVTGSLIEVIHERQRTKMALAVASFLKRVAWRAHGTRALLDALTVGQGRRRNVRKKVKVK